MDIIRMQCSFGDEIREVDIFLPPGTGSESWTILVNSRSYGSIIRVRGEWRYFERWLETAADVQIIGDIIDDYIEKHQGDRTLV